MNWGYWWYPQFLHVVCWKVYMWGEVKLKGNREI